jgi:hypothetical protein
MDCSNFAPVIVSLINYMKQIIFLYNHWIKCLSVELNWAFDIPTRHLKIHEIIIENVGITDLFIRLYRVRDSSIDNVKSLSVRMRIRILKQRAETGMRSKVYL